METVNSSFIGQETIVNIPMEYESQLINNNNQTNPCVLQSRHINPKTYNPTTLQLGNELGYPVTNHGIPIEYYQQNPPPRASYFESLFQPLPDKPTSLQLTLADESTVLATCACISCCPCVTCYVCVCVKDDRNSPVSQFCQCCNGLGKCAEGASCAGADCGGICTFIFSIAFLIVLTIIVLLIVTGLVSIPIILMALPFYGMYKLYDLKSVKIIMDEEKRLITVTTRRKYFKKDEIISEQIIPFDNILEISIKEIEKKNFIIAKCKDDIKINFNQFNSEISKHELQKGVEFLKKYFSIRGVTVFQMSIAPIK